MSPSERQERLVAALGKQYMPGIYERYILQGGPKGRATVTLVSYLALYREPDGSHSFASGHDGITTPANLAAIVQGCELPPMEAPGAYTVMVGSSDLPASDQTQTALNDLALTMAQDIMDQYGLPAAIAVLMRAANGQERVEFWYPQLLVPPDRLFSAFTARLMGHDWPE